MNNPDFIYALTIMPPFAHLIMNSEKQYETRGWLTAYRGPLVIHAGSGQKAMQDYGSWRTFLSPGVKEFGKALDAVIERHGGRMAFPTGVALGTVELVDCLTWEQVHALDPISEQERAFGHWHEKNYFWKLADPRPFATPIPIPGRHRLWRFPKALLP